MREKLEYLIFIRLKINTRARHGIEMENKGLGTICGITAGKF
jgi:hypothetical protein